MAIKLKTFKVVDDIIVKNVIYTDRINVKNMEVVNQIIAKAVLLDG